MNRFEIIKTLKKNDLWGQLSSRQQLVMETFEPRFDSDKQQVNNSYNVVKRECLDLLRDNEICLT